LARTRRGQAVIAVVVAAAAFTLVAIAAPRRGFFDLKVYYGAINFWAHGHGEVYDYLAPYTKYGFTYPPFSAFTMLPMAVLPWHVVITVSLVATVAVTAVITRWFLDPVVARQGWPRWFVYALTAALLFAFEPMRETLSFGQVNMLLVFLVVADLVLLQRSSYGGIGIGLATAIKLTPGIFIVYLLIARRYRAALVASATTAAATLLAAAVAPHASRIFWTDALWDTDRVGQLSYISNQSIEGFVARLHPGSPNMALWAGLVLVVLALWLWRVRLAVRLGDRYGSLALTGVLGCLISPVTWIHHLVWLVPALLLLVARGLAAIGAPAGGRGAQAEPGFGGAEHPRRRHRRHAVRLLVFAGVLDGLLSSRLVWYYSDHFTGWGLLFSNAYVLASLALLAGLPLVPASDPSAGAPGVADLREVDDGAVGSAHREGGPRAIGLEAEVRVEAAGPVVGLEHP
jgi:alpha-1,2-mannosyltransferase